MNVLPVGCVVMCHIVTKPSYKKLLHFEHNVKLCVFGALILKQSLERSHKNCPWIEWELWYFFVASGTAWKGGLVCVCVCGKLDSTFARRSMHTKQRLN